MRLICNLQSTTIHVMHHRCPTCHQTLTGYATFCDQCGASLFARPDLRFTTPHEATGRTTRLTHRAPQLWSELCVPLIGLLFAIGVVMSFALALATIGVSAGSVALVGVPTVGALFAQASWMQSRSQRGFFGMLACLVCYWGLILFAPAL